jgi:hypothetical protein
MPKHRCKPATIIYYETRGFLGTPQYREGGAPGKRVTFSAGAGSADTFEELMIIQSDCFNEIIAGADIEGLDFSKMIAKINELDPVYDKFAAFLLDTLTIVNQVRIFKKKAFNLGQQLGILEDKYRKLEKEYEFLQEHCDKFKEEQGDPSTSINLCIKVDIDLDLVYTLYQYFFGYPKDGVFDEEKANMIRKILEKRELKTITTPPWGGKAEPGRARKIRHLDDLVRISLEDAPPVSVQVPIDKPISIGDTRIETTYFDLTGESERGNLKFGQKCVIGFGGPNPENNYIVGFGSLILATPCKFDHSAGAIIFVLAQSRFNFLVGRIINVNGIFESFDITLDDGTLLSGIYESILEDGMEDKNPCPYHDASFENDPPAYICTQCLGDKIANRDCEICGIKSCFCSCVNCGESPCSCDK